MRIFNFNAAIIFILFLLARCSHPYCLTEPKEKVVKLKPGAEGKDIAISPYGGIYGDKNFGDDPYLTGYYVTDNLQIYIDVAYIDFDLSVIPKGVKIKKAILTLYGDTTAVGFNNMSLAEKINPDIFVIQSVITPWKEDSLYDDDQILSTGENRTEFPHNNPDYSCNIDITKLVQKQCDYPDYYFGYLIFLKNGIWDAVPEEQIKNMRYCSSDHPNQELHPELTISYEK
jgi:hypothetical protein